MTFAARLTRRSTGKPGQRAEETQLSSSVRRSAIWSVASTIVVRFANIAITAVIAHILDPRDFGVFAVASTAYAIVSSIGDLGVASCLMRADLDLDSLAPTVATVSLVTSAVLAGAMILFADLIATALGSSAAGGPIRVMAIAVMLVGVFAVPGAQLVRDFKQDKQFLANIISFVPSTVVLLILAKSGSGAMAFAWSRVAGQVVAGSVMVACVPRNYRPGLVRSALSVLFRFGLPLAGANFVNYILLNVDYALVGRFMGAVALGTYVLAFNVASWPSSLLGAMINNVSMPAFSRVKHDPDLLRSTMSSAVRAVAIVVMPICALSSALARPLVLTLYGSQWTAASRVLAILAGYSAVSVVCLLFANMLAGLGRTRFLFVVQLLWLGALAPAMALGVRFDGIVGAAVAHLIVIGPIVLPAYLFALKRSTGIRIRALVKAAWPAVLGSMLAAGAARIAAEQFGLPVGQLAAGLAAGGLVYLIAIAPLAVDLLGDKMGARVRGTRIFRSYNHTARFAGIYIDGRPKHSATRRSRRARHVQEQERQQRDFRTSSLRASRQ